MAFFIAKTRATNTSIDKVTALGYYIDTNITPSAIAVIMLARWAVRRSLRSAVG